MTTALGRPVGVSGLTDPYLGNRPASRVYAYGHTFRWVQGDRCVAVQRGSCVDTRRVLIIRDVLADHQVLLGYQPLVDVISIGIADWNDPGALRRIADEWAVTKGAVRHGL